MDRSHPRAFVRGCFVTVAALLAARLSGAPAAAAPLYSLTELPRGRYTSIAPADLNDAGHVVGSARIGGFTDGFLWTPAGGLVEIPHPTDATQVVPQALNNADLVVGYRVGTNLLQKAMTWSPQDPTVRMFGLSGAVQYAPAVNDAGQIAIETYGSNSVDTKDLVRNADGTYRQLADAHDGPPFTGGGVLRGITPRGDVIGLSLFSGVEQAVVWPATGVPRRLALPAGFRTTDAWAADALGQIVGNGVTTSTAPNPNRRRALLWETDGSVLDLGTLAGDPAARADDINDLGEVVGGSGVTPGAVGSRAFVWSAADGMRDLNTLLDPSGDGWSLLEATRVNNAGQILVTGTHGGVYAAALLTPVPEPAGAAVLLPATVALFRRRR